MNISETGLPVARVYMSAVLIMMQNSMEYV